MSFRIKSTFKLVEIWAQIPNYSTEELNQKVCFIRGI